MIRPRATPVVTTIVATLVVLAAATAGLVYAGWKHLDHNIASGGRIQHQVTKKRLQGAAHQPLNLLVMGVDTRDCAGCHVDKEIGGGGSDTTVLVHVAADRKSAYGISVPRDALVEPTGCTSDHHYRDTGLVQWNAAFSAGGPECTAQQLEKDFGVYVDGYITLDFGGFKGMVNAVGGVDVRIPVALDDPRYTHSHFAAGPRVHLDGPRALTYVRLRHVGDGTDLSRIERQQEFIAALTKKVVNAGTLARPNRLYGFAQALTSSIRTDPGLASVSALAKLAEQLRSANLAHLRLLTLPNEIYDVPRSDPYWGRVEVLRPAYKLMKRVASDQPIGGFGKDAVSADVPFHR